MLVCTLGRAYRIRSRSLRHGVAQHHTTAQIEMALSTAICNFQHRMGEPELSVYRAACANHLPRPRESIGLHSSQSWLLLCQLSIHSGLK